MAIDAATIQTTMDLAVAAIGDNDWATAMPLLRQAHAMLAAIPDSKFGETELEWDRESIAALIQDGQKQSASSTGIQVQKRTYVNVTG
jgi:hypothetical protein